MEKGLQLRMAREAQAAESDNGSCNMRASLRFSQFC